MAIEIRYQQWSRRPAAGVVVHFDPGNRKIEELPQHVDVRQPGHQLIDGSLQAIRVAEEALAYCVNTSGIVALAHRASTARVAFHNQLLGMGRHTLRAAFSHGLGLLTRHQDRCTTAILKFMLDEIRAEVQRRSDYRSATVHLAPHLALEHDLV